ncbi:tetratricopeptide repeat protein [Chitinophaga rhizosphaerae]|uniref:tetratricopeptide repeat protein n=1 Tax=Chitinophaga rhizosphaerae TaxID=1864947 RepID=UPI0013DFC799|nr:tetratricopeptide repeat protein [Chitinophaga rhizosphaerae]
MQTRLNIAVMLDDFLCRMKNFLLPLLLFSIMFSGARAQQPDGLPATAPGFPALKDSLEKALARKNPIAAAGLLSRMGHECYHLGYYPQALDYHLQAGQLYRKEQQWALLAQNLNDIGTLYYYSRQPEAARNQYNEALALYTRAGNFTGMAQTLGSIGHLCEKRQDYDSAAYYQHKALALFSRATDPSGIAKIYENLGSIHEDLEQYDSAFHYFQKSLELNILQHNNLATIEIYNNLGDILRKTGRATESLPFTRNALHLALQAREEYQLSSAYRDMARAFNLLGRNDSAFFYGELSRESLLNIYSRESGKQLTVIQAMYDTGKKDREIAGLRNSRNMAIFLVIGALLLVTLGVLVISRQRLRIRNAALLRMQEQQQFRTRTELLQLQEENLKQELETRSKVLGAHTLHIIQKNQLLEDIRQKLETMVNDERRDQKKQLRQLQQLIHQNFNHDQHWDEFRSIFGQIHQSFFDKIREYGVPLTQNDLRLVALLKMNLSSADIAVLLGISQDSLRVVRYRLRKKLQLPQGESLTAFIQSI